MKEGDCGRRRRGLSEVVLSCTNCCSQQDVGFCSKPPSGDHAASSAATKLHWPDPGLVQQTQQRLFPGQTGIRLIDVVQMIKAMDVQQLLHSTVFFLLPPH